MKKSRFSESQIVAILKEVELGAKVGETCRKHGVSEPTYYKWKSQYSGMTVPHLAQLRELQRLINACRTRGHRIHCKVGYGFAVRNGPHLGWYNP